MIGQGLFFPADILKVVFINEGIIILVGYPFRSRSYIIGVVDEPTYPKHPVGGVDYPRTRMMQEFDEWFSNETVCAAYLLRLR